MVKLLHGQEWNFKTWRAYSLAHFMFHLPLDCVGHMQWLTTCLGVKCVEDKTPMDNNLLLFKSYSFIRLSLYLIKHTEWHKINRIGNLGCKSSARTHNSKTFYYSPKFHSAVHVHEKNKFIWHVWENVQNRSLRLNVGYLRRRAWKNCETFREQAPKHAIL